MKSWGWSVGWNKQYSVAPYIDFAQRNAAWYTFTVTLPTDTFKGTISRLRIGPATWSGIVAARSGTQAYKMSSGTSYSAPVVSGIVALLRLLTAIRRGV